MYIKTKKKALNNRSGMFSIGVHSHTITLSTTRKACSPLQHNNVRRLLSLLDKAGNITLQRKKNLLSIISASNFLKIKIDYAQS